MSSYSELVAAVMQECQDIDKQINAISSYKNEIDRIMAEVKSTLSDTSYEEEMNYILQSTKERLDYASEMLEEAKCRLNDWTKE